MVSDTQALAETGAAPFYNEKPDGRIEHRAEPLMLVLALLVIPAIVLEEASANWLRSVAFGLNVVIWVGFASELAFVLSVTDSFQSRSLVNGGTSWPIAAKRRLRSEVSSACADG